MPISRPTDINNICHEIEHMSVEQIMPIARSAMRDDKYTVGSWAATPMVTDSIGIGTIGFVRVQGTASASTGKVD